MILGNNIQTGKFFARSTTADGAVRRSKKQTQIDHAAGNTPTFEPLENRSMMSGTAATVMPANCVSISTRYGNELVITASGTNDSVQIVQTGNMLWITADSHLTTNPVPANGVFVYTQGGLDTVNISSSVKAATTVETIDGSATTVNAFGSNVIAWVDSTDTVSGTASVHKVSSFAGGVSKNLGDSLSNPKDAGSTRTVNASLFGSGPVATDINQGGAADCYFLSSIAAFAQTNPTLIDNSVVDMGDGTYTVQLFSKGTAVYTRVSNSFSTGPYAGFNFAHPGANNSIWGMVMEKAFAFARTGANTYASTNNGFMTEVYTDLNQASSIFLPGFTATASMFTKLSTALSRGNAITLSTSTNTSLVANHAYMLVGATNINGVIQYTVRNPWGFAGSKLENGQGIATLTAAQFASNFFEGATTTY